MIKKFKATIFFDCDSNHPDAPNDTGLEFTDMYSFDTRAYGGNDSDMRAYMRHDLALVAGGGYATDTIINVRYNIQAIN